LDASRIGLMRDFDPRKPESTKIGKLCRKRLLEFLSKKSMEPRWIARVDTEIEALEQVLLKEGKNGTNPINPFPIILDRALSVVLQFGMGLDFDREPERLRSLGKMMQFATNTLVRLDNEKLAWISIPESVRNFIPLRFWPQWVADLQPFYDEIMKLIDEHDRIWQPGDEITTFIGQLEIDRRAGKMHESDMIHNVQELMLGGADTVTSTMSVLWLNLARFPIYQERLYKALEAVNFHCQNQTDCPYLLAFMYESYRYSPSIFRSLLHSVTERTEILGYTLERGDIIGSSLSGIAVSEKYFKDPYVFNPERFIDENGDFKKDENLLPFNYGRRSCPGQILANIELFHFTRNILERFELKMSPDLPLENEPNQESWDRFWSQGSHGDAHHHFMMPKELRILFVPRKR